MEAAETQALVADLESLKRRARADRRATSLPLLTFGAIALAGAAITAASGTVSNWTFFYWILAVPAGFGFLAWRQQRRAALTGVGGGNEPYRWFALGFPLLFVIPLGLLVITFPLAAIAAGLLYVAARQHNRYLGICAAVFGIVGTVEVSFAVVRNRLYEVTRALGFHEEKYGYFSWADALALGLLAGFLLGAGLVARRRETRAA
jgi:hypothetical protein